MDDQDLKFPAKFQTAADYRRVVYGRGARSRDALPPSELVWAGAEPTEFTNLFPVWRHDAAVEALNKKVGVLGSVARWSTPIKIYG